MDIAYRIRRARLKKGYSQDYMACQLELTTKTYRNIESGKSKIDVSRLINIASILEIDIVELLNVSTNRQAENCQNNRDNAQNSYDSSNQILDLYVKILHDKDIIIKHLNDIIEKTKKLG